MSNRADPSENGTSPREYQRRARLAHARFLLSIKTGPKRKGKRWMKKWCESDEGKKHLLQFAYSPDPWLAFGATRLLFAYAFGNPGSAPEKSNGGVKIDWRQYEGEGGKAKLKEDLAKEFTRYADSQKALKELDNA